MSPFELDSDIHPVAEARPFIEAFTQSRAAGHRTPSAVRGALEVLVIFLAMTTERRAGRLDYAALNPDLLASTLGETWPSEPGFGRDVLDTAACFYGFLGTCGLLDEATALGLRGRLCWLAGGVGLAA